MAERPIEERESKAAAVAREALAEPLKAAIDVLNLATKLNASDVPAEKLSKATMVKLLLLQRIQNDLRCCMILVEHGYSLQAVTQAGWYLRSLGNNRHLEVRRILRPPQRLRCEPLL